MQNSSSPTDSVDIQRRTNSRDPESEQKIAAALYRTNRIKRTEPTDDEKQICDPSGKTQISKMHYIAEGGMTADHIRHLFGSECAGKTQEELEQYAEKLTQEKSKILQWGRLEIEKIMVGQACQLGLKMPTGVYVENFKFLKKFWETAGDYDELYLKKVIKGTYLACIEWRENCSNWNDVLEEEYMREKNLIYDPDTKYVAPKLEAKDEEGRGCIARLLTVALKGVMRRLNSKARKMHGIMMSVQRSSRQIEKEAMAAGAKYTKRQKGWKNLSYNYEETKSKVNRYYEAECERLGKSGSGSRAHRVKPRPIVDKTHSPIECDPCDDEEEEEVQRTDRTKSQMKQIPSNEGSDVSMTNSEDDKDRNPEPEGKLNNVAVV